MELTAPQQIPQAAKTAPIRWCLYARKSSEQDERQALSIEQQIKEMELLADHWGIKIAEVRKESHSSKESGTSPENNTELDDPSAFDWPPDSYYRLEVLLPSEPYSAASDPTTGELFTPPDPCSTIPKEHFYADD